MENNHNRSEQQTKQQLGPGGGNTGRKVLLSVGDWERKKPAPPQKIHLPGRRPIKGRWSSRSQTQVTSNCLVFGHKLKMVNAQPCAKDSTAC